MTRLHPDLLAAETLVYIPSGLIASNFKKEEESEEYGAFDFTIHHLRIKFRVAKITPTKIGQFVTLWKRLGKGPILPYDLADPIDFFVISARDPSHFGQFVFPKQLLFEKGILSKDGQGGKRAIRIYPPWDIAENSQAKRTQGWQLPYFFEIPSHGPINTTRVQSLFK